MTNLLISDTVVSYEMRFLGRNQSGVSCYCFLYGVIRGNYRLSRYESATDESGRFLLGKRWKIVLAEN